MKQKGSELVFAKIDQSTEQEISKKYRVRKLPTFELFRQGHDDKGPLHYKGTQDQR
jgi:thioredoxin-like negative regulator of GroEL